jgi:hypothetical protein
MKILFVIALVSFVALAWAAIAITRHVRKNAKSTTGEPPDQETAKAIDLRLNYIARPEGPAPVKSIQTGFSYFNKTSEDPSPETPQRPRASTPPRP